jgi:hypothetical protein
MGWGMATVEYDEVRGPFYRARGWEGRRCGEGKGGAMTGSEGEEVEVE